MFAVHPRDVNRQAGAGLALSAGSGHQPDGGHRMALKIDNALATMK
jgi:hypothetical protein